MNIQRSLIVITRIFGLLLFLLLMSFQWFAYVDGSSTEAINQAGLQRVRGQALAKSALLIEYVPTLRVVALSDMQVALPLFEQEQNVLLQNQDRDIQSLLLDARPNYLALVAATKSIVANPESVTTPDQVAIILLANKPSAMTLNTIVVTMSQQYASRMQQLFVIEVTIDLLLFGNAFVYNWLHKRVRGDRV